MQTTRELLYFLENGLEILLDVFECDLSLGQFVRERGSNPLYVEAECD